jgi:hypothetical protein
MGLKLDVVEEQRFRAEPSRRSWCRPPLFDLFGRQ